MPLGEFQENMHLGEGLPLKRKGNGTRTETNSTVPRFASRFWGATSLSLLTAALSAAGIGLTCAELGHWPVASVALRSEGCCLASFAPVVRCAVWNASPSAKDTS
jgi:hypothetical protein